MLEVKEVSELGFDKINKLLDQATQSFQDAIDKISQQVAEGPAISQTNISVRQYTESSVAVLQVLQEASQANYGVRSRMEAINPTTNVPSHVGDYSLITQKCISRLSSIKHTMSQKLEQLEELEPSKITFRDIGIHEVQSILQEHEYDAARLQEAVDQLSIQKPPHLLSAAVSDPTTAQSNLGLGRVISSPNDYEEISPREKAKNDNRNLPRNPEATLLQVQATLSRLCPKTCRCDCHKIGKMRTPGLVSSIVGQFLVSYNSYPVWFPRVCSHPSCLNHSQSSIRLNYIFPQWMVRRAVSFSISWTSSLAGQGASMHLKVPRVIPESHDVWAAISNNNISRLQYLFAQKEVLPTDISQRGESLLLVQSNSCSLLSQPANYLGRRR